MTLSRKLQQGGNTPNLYNFYGKQYDYNDLAQAADRGLNDYLATLKRGEKDSNEFINAYNNIMSGIKDGSITIDNGQFHDSKGRYTNSDKKYKDYYGLMANYIYNNMGKSNVYQKPEDSNKISWGNNSVKTAVMRQLFNNDTGNLEDFLDLDQEKDGVRGINNRASYLSNALQSVVDNWDNTFQGYNEDDKLKYITLLTNASQALRDSTIDPGDYLALSKAVDGLNFREMLATGTPKIEQPTETTPTEVASTETTPTEVASEQPTIKLKHASLQDNSQNVGQLTAVMQKVPTKGLINILRNSFYNRNYNFGTDRRVLALFKNQNISSKAGVTATLIALQTQGVLKPADPDNPNLFYIPGLRTKKGTGWVWNKANNSVAEMKLEDIPYARAQLEKVQAHKNGGILFAYQGAQLPWYNGLQDYDQNKYSRIWGATQYAMNDKGEFLNTPFTSTGAGYGKNKYTTDPKYRNFNQQGKDAALAIENSQNYKNQTNRILSDYDAWNNAQDKSSFNDENNLFLRYTHGYDAKQSNDNNKFWNNNQLRTSWGPSGKNYYGQASKGVSNVRDRILNLRNDQQVSIGHNNYRASGTRYFYNINGVKHWVDPIIAKSGKYQVSTNGIKSTDGDTDWTDYELTGLVPQTANEKQTSINRIQQPESKPNWLEKNGVELAQDVAPLAVGAGRLFDSLHTNNKVADIVKKSIKPVLKNTYELYSPVTGAFSEMQFRNRQAADVRRQAAQPYTSDASLNAARSLDANRQAADLQYQGFLADDKEILRTKQEALKRQEDNTARRTDTANFNRASINQANRELAQIEAGRLKSNWQSRDNFLSGIEADLKQRNAQRDYDRRVELAENKQRSLSLDMQDMNRPYEIKARNLKQQYQDSVNDMSQEFNAKLAAWQAVNGEDADYTTQPFYKDYIAKARALRDKYYTDSDALAEEQSKGTRQYIEGLRTKMNQNTLFRKGGKLSPSTINLLHKVMK